MQKLVLFATALIFGAYAFGQKINRRNKLELIPHSRICFNSEGGGTRAKQLYLGDPLDSVRKHFVIRRFGETDSIYVLKQPFVHHGNGGSCQIDITFTFSKHKKLKKFVANWNYAGDTTEAARSFFNRTVLEYCMGCLWESLLPLDNVYHVETIPIKNSQFIFDFRGYPWKASYECF